MSKILQIVMIGSSISSTLNSSLYFKSIRIDDIPALSPVRTS